MASFLQFGGSPLEGHPGRGVAGPGCQIPSCQRAGGELLLADTGLWINPTMADRVEPTGFIYHRDSKRADGVRGLAGCMWLYWKEKELLRIGESLKPEAKPKTRKGRRGRI